MPDESLESSKSISTWRKGPPGWIVALAISLNVVVSWHLAGLNFAGYLSLWEAGGTALLSWSGTSVGLWLAYRVARAMTAPNYSSYTTYREDPFEAQDFVPRP